MKEKAFSEWGMGALAAMLVVAALAQAAPSGKTVKVDLAMAAPAVDFDEGLDVRDPLGRPVASPAARAQLRQLFVSTAFFLLTRPELPRMAEVLSALQKSWNALKSGFRAAATAVWSFAPDLWTPPVRRPRLAPVLWIALVLPMLSLFVRSGSSFPGPASLLSHLSTIVIRC